MDTLSKVAWYKILGWPQPMGYPSSGAEGRMAAPFLQGRSWKTAASTTEICSPSPAATASTAFPSSSRACTSGTWPLHWWAVACWLLLYSSHLFTRFLLKLSGVVTLLEHHIMFFARMLIKHQEVETEIHFIHSTNKSHKYLGINLKIKWNI